MKKVVLSVIVIVLFLGLMTNADETEFESEQDYDPYLVLVNKTHALPDGWENVVHLETVENSLGEENTIENKAYEQFVKLRDELLDEGIQIELDSVYRSVEEQQEIWDAWSADPELGEEYCKLYLAVPGYSEHHTGLAVDIFLIKDGKEIRENDDMIADVEDFAKIHELLPKYGFILRYLEGKEDITGYAYEPWHLRYINNSELATKITEENLTLEEYLSEH
ncbi:M15 family metallopeptidase [Candidatus Saccharibacteria bacterium]|nr:M15 family metallopeptidase [Candidatus Saccharibacteria bacterium]